MRADTSLDAVRRSGGVLVLTLTALGVGAAAAAERDPAQEPAPDAATSQAPDASSPRTDKRLYIYGYFSTRLEKTFNEPDFVDGRVEPQSAPAAWSHPFVHVMLQNRISDKFKAFLNLNGSGAGTLDVRNMWAEYAPTPRLNLRVGKIYRHFGLYNEILDAVPTYFGIEPPELFDADHLILSRTTNFMVLGELPLGKGQVRYSLNTDQGEGEPVLGTLPVGGDLRLSFADDRYTVGTSFYTSNGNTTPDLTVGQGSPKSGVLPWMEADSFRVYGGYAQLRTSSVTLQAEYWRSPHDARRSPSRVVQMVRAARPNAAQLARFLVNPAAPVSEANVAREAKYAVETWYARAGYSRPTRIGQLEPYLQWDWYRNPETIASKSNGGDNEAGVADDGRFNKGTIGIVFRPVPEVAVKLDGSSHRYLFHGSRVHYEEVRFDVSIVFGQ